MVSAWFVRRYGWIFLLLVVTPWGPRFGTLVGSTFLVLILLVLCVAFILIFCNPWSM